MALGAWLPLFRWLTGHGPPPPVQGAPCPLVPSCVLAPPEGFAFVLDAPIGAAAVLATPDERVTIVPMPEPHVRACPC